MDFKQLSKEEKYKLIDEYDAVPYMERPAWRKAHNVDKSASALMAYYRKERKQPRRAEAPAPSPSPLPSTAEERRRAVEEYDRLPHNKKQEWLLARGWPIDARKQISDWRRNLKKKPAPRAPKPNGAAAVPAIRLQPAPPRREVTLDEAINLLQVKVSIYTEILDTFERIKSGSNPFAKR